MTLSAIQNAQGFYTLCDLSQPQTIAQTFGLDMTIRENQEYLHEISHKLVAAALPVSSGIITEPVFSLPAFLAQSSILQTKDIPLKTPGLVTRVDSLNPDPASDVPYFSPEWGVEPVANNYAIAFLELHYNPTSATAMQKKQIAAEVFDYCSNENTLFLLKLSITSPSPEQPLSDEQFDEVQLTAVQELRSFCHLLAVEPPKNALAAATLTAELDVPWIVVGNQPSFEATQAAVRQSMDGGAQGVLVGDVLWREIFQMRREDMGLEEVQITEHIKTQVPARLQALSQTVNETVRL